MKKSVVLFIILSLIINLIKAQVISFPDPYFKDRLINHEPVIDINGDGEIQLTEAEGFSGNLDISGTISEPGAIQDLTGIEYFTSISSLNCEHNQISNLTLTHNISLQTLICNYNEITELEISNILALRTLSASGNSFDHIDLSNNINLEFFQSNFGLMSSLDTSHNPLLKFLYVQGNSLTYLDLTNNPLLIGLIIDDNEIETVNIDSNIDLNFFYCRNNLVSDLDLSSQSELVTLDCKNNPFLEYINIKNGANMNLIISGGAQSCNFEDLPLLEWVCLDDIGSDLATFISSQVGHQVEFINDCTLEISDFHYPKINLFPNPSHQILNVRSSAAIIQFEIYNLIGQRIFKKEMRSNRFHLDVSGLHQGMYIIRFKTDQDSYTSQRFIKH
jgi:hypothetical protein